MANIFTSLWESIESGFHKIWGDNNLHHAVDFNYITSVAVIIRNTPEKNLKKLLNLKDEFGVRPLEYATSVSKRSYFETANTVANASRPIYRQPRASMVILLLENGADPNLVDKHGDTTLIRFCKNYIKNKDEDLSGSDEILSALLEYDANPNFKNRDGDTALHILTRGKFEDREFIEKTKVLYDLLIKAGAKDCTNEEGEKPSDAMKEIAKKAIKELDSYAYSHDTSTNSLWYKSRLKDLKTMQGKNYIPAANRPRPRS